MSQNGCPGIWGWVREELLSAGLLPGLVTGTIIGITETIFAVSLASLIFSGEFVLYLYYGIGIALVTAAVMLVTIALISSVPAVMGSTQDTSSVILGVIAAGLIGTLSTAPVREKLVTVLVAIAISTLLTGIFFLVLGMFKLGGLVRFIPYPVIGGFLAGTGWLLMQGSFGVMSPVPVTFRNIGVFIRPDQLILWVPSIACALTLFIGMRSIDHSMTMPVILLGVIIIFYLALLVTGTSVQEAVDRGLLLGGLSGGATLRPLVLQNLLDVDWKAILGQSGNIAIMLVLCVVGLLLNASALELAIGRDIDLNRELKAAGIANTISGLCGGMAGYHALSLSALSYRMGGRGRLPGLVAGLICAQGKRI
jgi:SulP family sulfate permease